MFRKTIIALIALVATSFSVARLAALGQDDVADAQTDERGSLWETVRQSTEDMRILPLDLFVAENARNFDGWDRRYDLTYSSFLPIYRLMESADRASWKELEACLDSLAELAPKEQAALLVAAFWAMRDKSAVSPTQSDASKIVATFEQAPRVIRECLRDQLTRALQTAASNKEVVFPAITEDVDVLAQRWREDWLALFQNVQTLIDARMPLGTHWSLQVKSDMDWSGTPDVFLYETMLIQINLAPNKRVQAMGGLKPDAMSDLEPVARYLNAQFVSLRARRRSDVAPINGNSSDRDVTLGEIAQTLLDSQWSARIYPTFANPTRELRHAEPNDPIYPSLWDAIQATEPLKILPMDLFIETSHANYNKKSPVSLAGEKIIAERYELTFEQFRLFYALLGSAQNASREELLECARRFDELSEKGKALAMVAFYVAEQARRAPISNSDEARNAFFSPRFKRSVDDTITSEDWNRLVALMEKTTNDKSIAFHGASDEGLKERWEEDFRKSCLRFQFCLGDRSPYFAGDNFQDECWLKICAEAPTIVLNRIMRMETDPTISQLAPFFHPEVDTIDFASQVDRSSRQFVDYQELAEKLDLDGARGA